LPAAVVGLDRNRRPHAGVELAAERLDQLPLLIRCLHIALREHHLTVAGLQTQELHQRPGFNRGNLITDRASKGESFIIDSPSGLWQTPGRRRRAPVRPQRWGAPAKPSTSTGPAPAPMSRSPLAIAAPVIARAARAASSGVRPSARCAA